MKILKKIFLLLSPDERKKAVVVLAMILIMAFLDMLGVASIMPFVAVLSNPEIVENNEILLFAFNASSKLGVTSVNEFIFVLGFLVFGLLIISLSFKAMTVFFETRFSLMREYTIGKRLVEVYLNKPYSWFISRNSADLGKNILSEVNIVIADALIPTMNIIAQSAVSIAMISLLVYVDPVLAFSIALVFISAYVIIFLATRNLLSFVGKQRTESNQERFVAVNEAFGAAKEIKLGNLEKIYLSRFSEPAEKYARSLSSATLVGQLPRFGLEIIMFGGLLLVILYLMSANSSFSSTLPTISLYALAGYRLMPAMQGIYRSFTQLRFADSALDNLLAELKNLDIEDYPLATEPLSFEHSITLNGVFFSYPGAPTAALNNLNIKIEAGSNVGFVGPTGGGKTTTVDLILGLLKPQEGTLEVDGKVIDPFIIKKWQNYIGYVPQQIYLADDSIAANIAFGVEPENIDQAAVTEAAKIADLHNFICEKLPDQYRTKVGERGIRLSGGQRQRIGIARALYNNPKILVLDEATSALDNLTEKSIMNALYKLGADITVIMIAHRLTTVTECDRIFFIENGRVAAQGKFGELLKSSKRFEEMYKK